MTGQPPAVPAPAGTAGALDPVDSALLDTLLLEAPVAFAFYDTDLCYRRINRVLAEINGSPIEDHIGRRPSAVLAAPLGLAVEDMLRRVVDTGDAIVDNDFRTTDATGAVRYWQSQWFPAWRDASLTGVAVLVLDVTERRMTEEALRRANEAAERLLGATVGLSTALTVEEVAEVLRGVGRTALGARWSSVLLLDESGAHYRLHGIEPSGRDTERVTSVEVPLDLMTPVTEAIATRLPILVGSSAELLARFGSDRVRRAVESGAEQAWAVIPVVLGETAIGALRFSFDTPRTLDRDEEVFLEALAGQCSIALERARLYDRERRTASGLARSLIPDELPHVPGLELAARYLPGGDVPGDGAEVGGDWYDVFLLPSGRVALVLGDVMGKGVVAAAGMGRIRSALRALAFVDESPRVVLCGLDRLVAATEPAEQIITLVYLVVDPVTCSAVGARAGHPPVARVGADGSASLVDFGRGSTPLGLADDRTELTLALTAGDTFLAYSDGLVETRSRDISAGMDLVLGEAARRVSRPLPAMLDDVLARMLSGQHQDDDVTVLGVRFLG